MVLHTKYQQQSTVRQDPPHIPPSFIQGMGLYKVAKGTRDLLAPQTAQRQSVLADIIKVFQRHGAVCIETPVLELTSTLRGHCNKLIYDLADQGGEQLSLRYDLTVPLARMMSTHNLTHCRRYQVGTVYRRDQPQPARGRFREFTQCDFDIAGKVVPMAAEAEVLLVLQGVMEALGLTRYVVRVNHRASLVSMLTSCGVPSESFDTVCSSIDKLDKCSWDTVSNELTQQKGISSNVAACLGEYLSNPVQFRHSDLDRLNHLLADQPILSHLQMDNSLARGLQYYTGLIYEVCVPGTQVGSVAAGGRYGEILHNTPSAVGISFGLDRLITVLPMRQVRVNPIQVMVASVGQGLFEERWKLARELWARGIAADCGIEQLDLDIRKQLGHAKAEQIPLVAILGTSELLENVVRLKDMFTGLEHTIPRDKVLTHLLSTID